MEREQASYTVTVQWLVVGLFCLGLSSCSLQKRTTLPGWHWEHEKTAIHQGPISNAEAFLKDRGRLVNLPPVGHVSSRRLTSPGHFKFQLKLPGQNVMWKP